MRSTCVRWTWRCQREEASRRATSSKSTRTTSTGSNRWVNSIMFSYYKKNIFTKNTQLFFVLCVFTSVPWKYLVFIMYCECQVFLFFVLKLMLIFSQMEDSEGTVRQIGAFSEEIQNLTVRIYSSRSHPYIVLYRGCEVKTFCLFVFYQSMLKDDEFFKVVSNSPNLSVTDEDSNAWDRRPRVTWSCCEWNSVPTLSSHTKTQQHSHI